MFKSEKSRLKEHVKQLTCDLTEANHKIRILEQEIAKRDDQLFQTKAQLKANNDQIALKNEEVSDADVCSMKLQLLYKIESYITFTNLIQSPVI